MSSNATLTPSIVPTPSVVSVLHRRYKHETSPSKISHHIKDGRKHIRKIARSLFNKEVRQPS